MTNSLNLPSGSALPGDASFQRRKNYDPVKAVEQEKLRRIQQQQHQQQQLNLIQSQYGGETSNETSFVNEDLSLNGEGIPAQALAANVGNKQVLNFVMSS